MPSKRLLYFQLVKLAKRLKKEKVNVDIINFGEEVRGPPKLALQIKSLG